MVTVILTSTVTRISTSTARMLIGIPSGIMTVIATGTAVKATTGVTVAPKIREAGLVHDQARRAAGISVTVPAQGAAVISVTDPAQGVAVISVTDQAQGVAMISVTVPGKAPVADRAAARIGGAKVTA
jgi:hypothetical protein